MVVSIINFVTSNWFTIDSSTPHIDSTTGPGARCAPMALILGQKIWNVLWHNVVDMGVFAEIMGTPPNHPILIGFGTIINHPFWGPTPIFGDIHMDQGFFVWVFLFVFVVTSYLYLFVTNDLLIFILWRWPGRPQNYPRKDVIHLGRKQPPQRWARYGILFFVGWHDQNQPVFLGSMKSPEG